MRTSPELQRPELRNRLVLRAGSGTALFLLSGGGGDLHELDPLVAALPTRRPLIGVPYWEAGADGTVPASVEAMADVAVETIRAWQPHGPYRLLGYSLGGLVAVEVARRLTEQRQQVRPPILIDPMTYRSAWSLPVFARAALRYTLYRARRLRANATAVTMTPLDQEPEEVAERCREVRKKHRPTRYAGRIALLHAVDEPYVGGLAPAIWRELAHEVDSFPIPGRHLDMLRLDSVTSTLARTVSKLIDTDDDGKRRALVVTGLSWDTTAHFARELDRVGFAIEALGPAGHPLARMEGVAAFHTLHPLNAQRSIEAAIVKSRPDIVIPADDFVTDLLHNLHGTTRDAGVRATIERSLGNPQFYSSKYSRVGMADLAVAEKVAVPRTVNVESAANLGARLETTGTPAFLKVDCSWGGTGVDRIESLAGAQRAWRRQVSPLRMLRGIKRALFNGDVSGLVRLLRRQQPLFSLQSAVEGQLVIVSAVCHEGELLGMISARVLSQQSAFGPATTIQIDDALPVREAVVRIIRRLGLSGFCGFDFILSPTDRVAYFIELNPRVTRTADLLDERGGDPLAALLDSLGGRGRARKPLVTNGVITKVTGVGDGSSALEGRGASPIQQQD